MCGYGLRAEREERLENVVIRLRFVILQREATVLGRCVYVRKQPVATTESFDLLCRHDPNREVGERLHHRETPLRHPPRDGVEAGARVGGTERMIPAFGVRDDRIGLLGETRQVRQERRGHVRHVAGDDDDEPDGFALPTRFQGADPAGGKRG